MKTFHGWILHFRKYDFVKQIYFFIYRLATKIFVWSTRRINRKFRTPPIASIYLRRGGGRSETLPGASDLDFFLVLDELDASTEMFLLTTFWRSFRFWKRFFPFLGETLMANRAELANWSSTPTVRAFEAQFSWKLLWGEPILENIPRPPSPELRDVLSECAKAYWSLLKPICHQPSLTFKESDPSSLQFRHAAKGAVDLFRMHYSFVDAPPKEELIKLWQASRVEVLGLLPLKYGTLRHLRPLLELSPCEHDVFSLLRDAIFQAFLCLDEISLLLQEKCPLEPRVGFSPYSANAKVGTDSKYSYAVRELFAERMISRHKDHIHRALISESTTHVFFPFVSIPIREKLHEVLDDLREAGTSFNQSSVTIPLSESTMVELERTSFLDNPFHAFHAHQCLKLKANGHIESSPYVSRAHDLPVKMLQKTFAEISMALRFQPPPNLEYVIENLINLVIQLRVAEENKIIATDFYAAVEKYSENHLVRANYLKEKVGHYLGQSTQEEADFWSSADNAINQLAIKYPHRANFIKAQLTELKDKKMYNSAHARQVTTGLWTEMTPFLRQEMNAMRDHYFSAPSKLKL